jgi:sugar (pentulose or hexulose) kinase
MEKVYLLGLDSGTSVVKAVLLDQNGQEAAVATRRTALQHPHPGWSEVSMSETWEAAAGTIHDLLQSEGVDKKHIAAVGVSGNMIGAWLMDEFGQPVRNAILWNDGRTRALLERLNAEYPGFMSEVFQVSGSVLEHGCTLPVVRWLADHEPLSLERARYVLHAKDWIRFKLSGKIHTDISEVPGLPGDARTQDYSEELFELFGISRFRPLFPPAVPSEAIVGEVLPEAAALTGLLAGTPVAAGAGDVPSVALGVGAVETGIACSILGTHCINGLVLDQPVFEPLDVGILFTIPGHRWMRALANVAGTTNLDWFINQFCGAERAAASSSAELFAAVEKLVAQSEAGARGILYHPYLSSVGIIAPFFEPAARAQFFGLTIEHQRADLLRAVYEGVAMAIRDCYAALHTPIAEIRLSGGGARSQIWGHLIADCVGVRVVIPAGSEFGAKGAALLAGVGIGWFKSISEAAKATLKITRAYEPDPTLKPLYDTNYELYQNLRDTLRPIWQQAAKRRSS